MTLGRVHVFCALHNKERCSHSISFIRAGTMRFQLIVVLALIVDISLTNEDKQTSSITESNSLNCDFYNSLCSWRNHLREDPQEDTIPWKIATVVATDFLHSIPRGVLGPGDTFAYVQGAKPLELQTALLTSQLIPCQSSKGLISFYLWSTVVSPSGVELCLLLSLKREKLICPESNIGYQGPEWKYVSAVVPQLSVPFKFIIKARVQGPQSIIGIDKIEYKADVLCDPSSMIIPEEEQYEEALNANSPQPDFLISDKESGDTVSTDILSEGQCAAADCDFEKNLCEYEIISPNLNFEKYFSKHCKPLAEYPKLRPLNGRCFLALSSGRQDRMATGVLVSPAFFLYEPSQLSFSYLLSAERTTRLTVCLDNLNNCVWDQRVPPRLLANWWTQRVDLAPGRQQIFFILEQHNVTGMHMALDNVRLLKSGTGESANCTLY